MVTERRLVTIMIDSDDGTQGMPGQPRYEPGDVLAMALNSEIVFTGNIQSVKYKKDFPEDHRYVVITAR